MASSSEVPNLVQRLAEAEQQLIDDSPSLSGSMSLNSEERDSALQVQEDAERQSGCSSGASDAALPDQKSPKQRFGGSLPGSSVGRGSAVDSQTRLSGVEQESRNSSAGEPGSSSVSSTEQKASMDMWQKLMDAEETQHGGEISEVLTMLRRSKKQEEVISEDNAELLQKIAAMEARHAMETRDWKEQLAHTLESRVAMEEAKGDLEDEMAAMKARHITKVDNLLSEQRAYVEKETETQQIKASAAKAELVEDNLARRSKSGLASPRKSVESSEDETVVLRRNMQTLQATYSSQLANLKAQLNKAALDKAQRAVPLPTGDSDVRKIARAQSSHQDMTDELNEMRQQLLEAQKNEDNQVGDLQMMLDVANLKLEQVDGASSSTKDHLLLGGRPSTAASRRKLLGKKLLSTLSKLDAIDEDDLGSIGLDMSCAASGNVSGFDDGTVVGDMNDFDDGIDLNPTETLKTLVVGVDLMKEEMREDRKEKAVLQEEIAGKDAQYASKISRLIELLKASRQGRQVAEEELAKLKQSMAGEDAKTASRMDSLARRLELAEARNSRQAEELQAASNGPVQVGEPGESVDELLQQINCLKEAKRIAEARMEDLKREMASMVRKHTLQVDELTHRLQKGGFATAGEDWNAVDELENLRQRLKSSEEERNVLANSFEGKEVQWKSRIENMEQEMEDLKRKHELELKESTFRLETEVAELRAGVAKVSAHEKLEAQSATPTPPPPAGGILSLLRCPVRSAGSELRALQCRPAYCQDICWKVLTAVKDVLALMCSIGDYAIVEASKEACRTWGSAALQGKSVLTLANGPASAAWLRKAFETHQRFAEMEHGDDGPPGFIVRDLGCESFTTKAGNTFDSSVITAHLPAEPSCRKQAALLVIIEPHARSSGSSSASSSRPMGNSRGEGRADGREGRREERRSNQRSSQSEVSTSTINPDDSASNIHVRGNGMWMR